MPFFRGAAARARIALLAALARLALRCLRLTTRRAIGADGRELFRAFTDGRRVLVAFWHGHLALAQLAYPGRRLCIQVSRHADGEIVARAVGPLGIRAARGSATRGGVGAVREMLRAFEEGFDLAVAVDGPRGPRHRVKEGAIRLAEATGAPIVPVAAMPRRALVFRRSWDHFTVPLPFTTIFYAVGEPLAVPRGVSAEGIERLRVELERRLGEVATRAAERAGGGDVAA